MSKSLLVIVACSCVVGSLWGAQKRRELGYSEQRWFQAAAGIPTMGGAYGPVSEFKILDPWAREPKMLELKNGKGETALMVALGSDDADGRKIERIELFLRHGADINAVNDAGESVLDYAKKYNQLNIIQGWPAKKAAEAAIDAWEKEQKKKLDPRFVGQKMGVAYSIEEFLKNGKDDEVIRLLEEDPNLVFKTNQYGDTLLMLASRYGRSLLVDRIIETGKGLPDINTKNPSGETALFIAARNDDAIIAKKLIAAGADVNAVNKRGMTPLIITNGYATAKTLIDNKANVNVQDNDGRTALIYATNSMHEKSDVIRLLLDHGAEINKIDKYGTYALERAVTLGYYKVVQLLIERGADTTRPDLVIAAARGVEDNADILNLLIKHGAKAGAVDEEGKTDLMYAAEKGNSKTAKILIDKGSNVNAQDNEGKTALMWASLDSTVSDTFGEVIALLLENGARADIRDKEGKSALDYAKHASTWLEPNKLRAIGLLENNIAKETGGKEISPIVKSAWFIAIEKCDAATIKSMLQKHPDIAKVKSYDGTTGLMRLARNDKADMDVLNEVIKHSDIDAQKDDGYTALIIASVLKNATAVRALLKAGANTEIRDERGNTALDHARDFARILKDDSIVALLSVPAEKKEPEKKQRPPAPSRKAPRRKPAPKK